MPSSLLAAPSDAASFVFSNAVTQPDGGLSKM